MALRKIYLAVDCENDAERDAVQGMANEISNMRVLNSRSLISVQPLIQRNGPELKRLFTLIANGGPKALLSMEGARLLMSLRNK